MKSVAVCVVLLTLLHCNVFAGISFGGQIESTNEDAKIFPEPGKPAANNTSHSGRIVNGNEGSIENYPYILHLRAELEDNMFFVCGASIITYSHALTAGHCVYDRDAASITLYGGSTSRTSGGIVFTVSKVVVHPNYDADILENDVAIVQVTNTFRGYKNIVPIALHNAEVPPGTSCYAVGWGVYDYDTQIQPEILQYAMLRVLSAKACRRTWPSLKSITCAQQGNGVDICQGDSGGPLVCNGKLTGSSSFVGEGCRGEYPAGFAKITFPAIRQFIKRYAGV